MTFFAHTFDTRRMEKDPARLIRWLEDLYDQRCAEAAQAAEGRASLSRQGEAAGAVTGTMEALARVYYWAGRAPDMGEAMRMLAMRRAPGQGSQVPDGLST